MARLQVALVLVALAVVASAIKPAIMPKSQVKYVLSLS
jgi:hypothetical protein